MQVAVRHARQGILPRSPGRVPPGDLAEPRGSGQLHGGGDRGRPSSSSLFLGAVDSCLARVGRVGPAAAGGKDSEMSGTRRRRPSSGSSSTPTRGSRTRWREAIESRAKIFGLSEMIGRVLVPTEKVRRDPQEQKIETEQKFFPGYLLVEMELTDDTWHLVRSTPKVTGLRRLGRQAGARCPTTGRRDPAADGGGRREAQAQVHLPEAATRCG